MLERLIGALEKDFEAWREMDMRRGKTGTLLYTGKRLVGPFDAEEMRFLREGLSRGEQPALLRITEIDREKGTVTFSSDAQEDPRLSQPLDVLDLDGRAWRVLTGGVGIGPEIKTVGDLVKLREFDLLGYKTIGKKTQAHIIEKVRAYGFEMAK